MITDNEQQGKGNFSTSARKARLTTTMNTMGKVPPQAIDLEEAVLGALMLEKDAYVAVCEFLKKECFYKDVSQGISRLWVNRVIIYLKSLVLIEIVVNKGNRSIINPNKYRSGKV